MLIGKLRPDIYHPLFKEEAVNTPGEKVQQVYFAEWKTNLSSTCTIYEREMSAMRQPSEWGIGRVKSLFSFLEFKVRKPFKIIISSFGESDLPPEPPDLPSGSCLENFLNV